MKVMRILIPIISIGLLGVSNLLYAQDFQTTIITDPSISRRCEALLKKRGDKIEIKQRLSALIVRNRKLQSLTPTNKETIKRRLQANFSRLEKEYEMSLIRIQKTEESIVRQGCPGVTL